MQFLRYILCAPIVFLFYLAVSWGTKTFGKGLGELVVPSIILSIPLFIFLGLYLKGRQIVKAREKGEGKER